MRTTITLLTFCLLITSASGLAAFADNAEESIQFDLDHFTIEIDATYQGTKLEVTGSFPRYRDIILKMEGAPQEINLNRKGKWLILWMNVAHVKVTNAPQIYYIQSTRGLEEISADTILIPLKIGYHALEKTIHFSSDKELNGEEFSDFIKLQEHQERYDVSSGTIIIESIDPTIETFTAHFDMPAMAPPGIYTLKGYCFREGKLESQTSAEIEIVKKGLPLLMTNLAFNSAAVYGIVAILAAIITGLLMGVIFGKKAKAH